jgi:hypothetical protein
MQRAVACAAVLMLVAAVAVPASAETWVQVRYWPTNARWDLTLNPTWTSAMWGLTIRHTLAGGAWAASFNIDSGPITNDPWGSPGQFNRFWNINLHRNFRTDAGLFSVYAGWGSSAFELPNFTFVPAFIRHSGPRLGVDARVNFRERWHLAADLGYTFNGTTTAQCVYTSPCGPEPSWNSSVFDARIGIGYTVGGWGLEAGYRWINWAQTNLPATAASVCPGLNCGMAWNGLYVGLNFSPVRP